MKYFKSCQDCLQNFFIFVKIIYMDEDEVKQAKVSLLQHFVTVMVELAEPEDDEFDEITDDFITVADLIFQATGLTIESVDGSKITASFMV